MKTIIMPQVGQDVPSAAIVEWLKKEGDAVKKGEPVLVVESDKASFEVEAEENGVLLKILHAKGDVVEIFKPVGYTGQPGEKVEERSPGAEAPAKETKSEATKSAPTVAVASTDSSRIFASPSARRVAHENRVDLGMLSGTGPNGRIIKQDVLAYLQSSPAKSAAPAAATSAPVQALAEDRIEPYSRMRKRIAERMSLSVRTIPHFYLTIDVNMTSAMAWREQFNRTNDSRVSVNDLVIYASAKALRLFPYANAHVDDEKVVLKKDINVGVAVSVDDGLLVPVIGHADALSIDEIAAASKQNAESARRGIIDTNIRGTFTISSLGMYGIRQFMPIVNPPESAILAVGAIEPRCVPILGGTEVHQTMTLTLGADHRALDGAYGARFLNQIKNELESIR